jgi:catechol 2,3-dioxygenase-like lactoylglutathione lyase family enzyme
MGRLAETRRRAEVRRAPERADSLNWWQHHEMPVATQSYAHIRLTVTDIQRSRAFYDDLFGLPNAFEVPANADDATREQLGFLFGGVIYRLGDALLGLRPSPKTASTRIELGSITSASPSTPGRARKCHGTFG